MKIVGEADFGEVDGIKLYQIHCDCLSMDIIDKRTPAIRFNHPAEIPIVSCPRCREKFELSKLVEEYKH